MRIMWIGALALMLGGTELALADSSGAGVRGAGTQPDQADQAKLNEDKDARSRVRPISIEELTVTARKREEKLIDTPVAVTAIARPELRDLNIRRIQDITSHVPNLAFDNTGDTSNGARINLRGVGNGDSIASDDPGVGLYVDGVYLARAQGALIPLMDIERVEVLRGPQGTLFGKNTIGGAINVITAKPDLTRFGGEASVRAGNYDLFESRVTLNVPLVPETMAARFGFATTTRDGFTKNKSTGSDLDDDKLLAFRAQLRAVPTDRLEINLSAEHTLEDRKPQGFKCKVTNPFPAGQTAQTRPDLAATGTRFQSAPASALLTGQIGVADPVQQQVNLITGANPFLAACAEDDLRDTRSVASELSFQKEDLKTFTTNGSIAWELSENLTLKSISAWRRQELDQARDFDATPFALIAIDSVQGGLFQNDQWSQEIQLIGSALDDRLDYVLGVFALREKTNSRDYVGVGVGQTFSIPTGLPAPLPAFVPSMASFVSNRLKVHNFSYAAFGQGTYAFTKDLSLTLGLRVTHERKQIRRDDTCSSMGFLCITAGQQLFGFEGATRSKDVSPVATLQYALGDSSNVYVSWARAFKSGGFNGRLDDVALGNEIDDERLTSYEVGFKTVAMDSRVSLSGALFTSVYKDIQLSITRSNPITGLNQTFVTNAGRAEVSGAELELRAILMPGLELTSALGATHARYTEFDAPVAPSDPLIPDDPEDRQLPNTPTYTMNFGLSYEFGIGRFGDVRARTDWTHIGRSGSDTQDSPELRKGKHGEIDAQLVWLMPDGATEVALFGDNLFDREYVTNGINLGASFGNALLLYNEPRTYGIEVRRSF